GTTTADGSGRYQAAVAIPSQTSPGDHQIVVSGPGGTPQARATITVLSADTASSGSSSPSAASGGASLALTGGGMGNLLRFGVVAFVVGCALRRRARRS
ncbi:MAG: hypothetical protein LC713_04900, partial [Actinobacteria bacterium]|nr:hypothetical protein [Actinomycetota bacterium]